MLGIEPSQTGQITLFQPKEVPNTFRKAVQVVHSMPLTSLSLLQRKVLNAWIKKAAQTEPDTSGWWSIRIDELSTEIGYHSNNRTYLRSASEALMKIVFQWDVIASTEKRVAWKASVLFPEVEISSEVVRFQISSQLREHVLNPVMYALIDQTVLKKYRRAASGGIYEHCMRFHKIGRTAIVPWEQFRDMVLGVSASQKTYQVYKFFKAKVLLPAIAEVNAEGAIKIQLGETKSGRSIEGVYFTVVRRTNDSEEGEIDDGQKIELVELMVKLGVPQSEARNLTKQFSATAIRDAIEFTNVRRANKKLEKLINPAAHFRRSLNENWASSVAADVTDVVDKTAKIPRVKSVDIAALFRAKLMNDAREYFDRLDIDDQQMSRARYNDQQELKSFKLTDKVSKPAEARFFQWLANDCWGEPTGEQILQFAETLLNNK